MMPEYVREEHNADYAVIDKVNKRYFSEIEYSVPHFQQTLFDLQNECYKSWKNMINSNTELQKELLWKSGFNLMLPKVAQEIIDSTGERIIKYRLSCIKIAIATIEFGTKHIKIWNDNANMFLDLNRKIMHNWFSPFMMQSDVK
jgi:hypothetical protein